MGFPILVRQHLYIESGSRFYVRAPLHMLKINDRHQTKNWAGPVKFSPGQVKLHKIKWKRKFCGRLNENFSFEHCSICTDLCQKCVSSIHWFSWESPAQLNHITYMFSKPSISFHFILHSIFWQFVKALPFVEDTWGRVLSLHQSAVCSALWWRHQINLTLKQLDTCSFFSKSNLIS